MSLRSFGIPELLIILAIIVLIFGAGRIGKIAGELGKGFRLFKNGLNAEKLTKAESAQTLED